MHVPTPPNPPVQVSQSRLPEPNQSKVARFAWLVLGINIAVVVWGAYVRATGSGAGCGSHWPLCNGVILPQSPGIKTIIEFTHRLSSGLALILVVSLGVWVFRVFPKKHLARLGAASSLFFIFAEAGIGAGLVLLKLVAENASLARAIYLCVHLINTFLLLGTLALTAWWATHEEPLILKKRAALSVLLAAGLAGMMILGASGAIAALGDTLFPSQSFFQGLRQDFSSTSHILLKLRVFHPFIAVGVGIFLLVVAGLSDLTCGYRKVQVLARTLIGLILVQLMIGVLNVGFLAPTWLQLVHLFFADLIWITLVLLSVASLSERPVELPKSPLIQEIPTGLNPVALKSS